MFLNLVLNAAQAIEEKVGDTGARDLIVITTRASESEAIIVVSDDGAGIPAEVQDRIYEPFFTTKPVGKGTGQGLALARATVERHAGALECCSIPGQGASFTIRLPLNAEGAARPSRSDPR